MVYKPSPPLWGGKIEPGIKPLVDALNATRIIQTTSSCEAHYGYHDPDDFTERDAAYVAFEPAEGVTEDQLVDLFKHVSERYFADPDLKWEAVLEISRRWVISPGDPRDLSEVLYWIHVRPFNLHASDDSKRRATDAVLEVLAEAVRTYKPS